MIKNGLKHIALYISIILSITSCKNTTTNTNPIPSKVNSKPNVEIAREEKQSDLIQKLKAMNIDWNKVNIHMQAYKYERILEIWCKNNSDEKFQQFTSYEFCNTSGDLGPKRKEGDKQIPEGLYEINILNPYSSYYLSLGINYPNKSDIIRSDATKPGGEIYLHGGCATLGCIPITDDKIKELFILTEKAKNNHQKALTIHIYPFRMNEENMMHFKKQYKNLFPFWMELKPFYNDFVETHKVANFTMDTKGHYLMK